MIINDDNLLLSEKLATRMCHDLSGVSMAISNSVEMIADKNNDDDFKKMATDIAFRGAKGLEAKIKFFRIAFGTTGSELASADFRQIVKNYVETVSNKGEINISDGLSSSAIENRILFNYLIFALGLVSSQFRINIYKDKNKFCCEIKNYKDFVIPNELGINQGKINFFELTPKNAPLFLGDILANENEKKLIITLNKDLLMLQME